MQIMSCLGFQHGAWDQMRTWRCESMLKKDSLKLCKELPLILILVKHRINSIVIKMH